MILISYCYAVDPIKEYMLSIKYIVIAQTMLAATVIMMVVASCLAFGIIPFAFIFIILNRVTA